MIINLVLIFLLVITFFYLLGMESDRDFIHTRIDRLEMAIKNQDKTLEKLEKSIAQSCEKDDADGKSI